MKQWYRELALSREGQTFNAGLAFVQGDLNDLLLSRQLLNHNERVFFDSLQFDRRKTSYLLGRISSKNALMNFTGITIPESIWLDFGVFQFPIVRCREIHNVQVSLSHCNNIGVCIAFPESHPMGIDIEEVLIDKLSALEKQITESERGILINAAIGHLESCTLIWTVKESLSKILKTGMMIDYGLLELDTLKMENGVWISTFTNFRQYRGFSCLFGNYVISWVLPRNTQVNFNPVLALLTQ
jgi:4'-phosphopantetheinyl transferase